MQSPKKWAHSTWLRVSECYGNVKETPASRGHGHCSCQDPRAVARQLKIGDDWNAITIIALSQSNPLKAIAELVENWYLAAELRDRIRQTGVKITVIDRLARKQYAVEPRQYEGRLLQELPAARTPFGDIYAELYLNEPADKNAVALFRQGTRVIEDIALLDGFAHPPGRCVISKATWMHLSLMSPRVPVPASSAMLPMPPFAPD